MDFTTLLHYYQGTGNPYGKLLLCRKQDLLGHPYKYAKYTQDHQDHRQLQRIQLSLVETIKIIILKFNCFFLIMMNPTSAPIAAMRSMQQQN